MPRPVTVEYRVLPNEREFADASAKLFADCARSAVDARGVARVAISGGNTPKAMFAELANSAKPYFAITPWANLELFWVDERCVPPTHKDSNYREAKEVMLSKVPLNEAQVHRMEGELDPAEAASRYESEIRNTFKLEGAESPVFDLVLLGMGDDGHTASLFPHTEALGEMSRIVVSNFVPQKDTRRITLTWPVINAARNVVFLVEGDGKAAALRDVFLGAYEPELKPSQLIRPASGRLTLLLDRCAAAELPPPSVSDDAEAVGKLELR